MFSGTFKTAQLVCHSGKPLCASWSVLMVDNSISDHIIHCGIAAASPVWISVWDPFPFDVTGISSFLSTSPDLWMLCWFISQSRFMLEEAVAPQWHQRVHICTDPAVFHFIWNVSDHIIVDLHLLPSFWEKSEDFLKTSVNSRGLTISGLLSVPSPCNFNLTEIFCTPHSTVTLSLPLPPNQIQAYSLFSPE